MRISRISASYLIYYAPDTIFISYYNLIDTKSYNYYLHILV